MIVRHVIVLLSLVFAIGLIGPVRAQDADDIDHKIDRMALAYTVDPSGAMVRTVSWTKSILKKTAIASAKQTEISYSTSVEKLDILEAYTLKADGKRIDVPKDNYQQEVNSGKGKNNPAFSDYTTLSLIFPDVTEGDKVAISYRVTETQPMFPQRFSLINSFEHYTIYDDVKISVDVPLSLHPVYKNYGLEQISDREQDGRRHIELAFSNPKREKPKENAGYIFAEDPEKEPGFAISNFASYQAVAEAYGSRATPKAMVTPRIQALANDVTKQAKNSKETTRDLYEWVRDNITYAGNCIGTGSVVPRDLDFVLDNKIGDCKDHATLLQALLKAKGIENTQALINAGEIFSLPMPPVISTVNHVINYIPSQDLFLDATSKMPFGQLAPRLRGKPVLLVDGYKEGKKTPPTDATDFNFTLEEIIRIAADGTAKGSLTSTVHGYVAEKAWRDYKEIGKARLQEYADHLLKQYNHIGSLTITPGLYDSDKGTFPIRMDFEIKDFLALKGPRGNLCLPAFCRLSDRPFCFHPPSTRKSIAHFSAPACRRMKLIAFTFPDKVHVLATPDGVDVKTALQSYTSTYKLDGQTLSVSRKEKDTTLGPVCQPDVNTQYKTMAEQVIPDLKAQIVYK